MEDDRTKIAATIGHDLAEVFAAHVVMLRDEAVLEDTVAGALLTALDAARRETLPADEGIAAMIAALDARWETLTPPGARGAATLGRGGTEIGATLVRLMLRDGLLDVADRLNGLRRSLIELARAHAITLMPAYSSSQVAQPTTFAHYLGGLIGPLGRSGQRLPAVFGEINQSPMGAVALTSSSLGISRERMAALLGFDGPVPNTFDAVAAVDHVALAADWAVSLAVPIRRFASELLVWLRTHPDSLRLADVWTRSDPALPQMTVPAGLEVWVALAEQIEQQGRALAAVASHASYQPVTALNDQIYPSGQSLCASAGDLLARGRQLFGGDLQVNRAYLANRAGRAFTTAGDLAIFLMIEEQLEPAAARDIARLTLARAIDEGLEISAITPERIDIAALTVIGRELKVELETISRYLAPRRFLERREATGSPAPGMTRAYLDREAERLATDNAWLTATRDRLEAARAERQREVETLLLAGAG